jgi:hypothetical protein
LKKCHLSIGLGLLYMPCEVSSVGANISKMRNVRGKAMKNVEAKNSEIRDVALIMNFK